jgi:hypothetical protein
MYGICLAVSQKRGDPGGRRKSRPRPGGYLPRNWSISGHKVLLRRVSHHILTVCLTGGNIPPAEAMGEEVARG